GSPAAGVGDAADAKVGERAMSSSAGSRRARSARTGNMGAGEISGLPSRVQALKHRRNAKKFNALPSRKFAKRSRTIINPPGLGWSPYNNPKPLISKVGQFWALAIWLL